MVLAPNDPTQLLELMETAQGRRFPDLVITGTDLVNVYTREVIETVSISIKGERIAYIGPKEDFAKGPDTRVVDGTGKIALPGFIEGHTHLATLLPVHTFLPYAAKGGTTTIITETMEMYPVGGRAAVEEFLSSLKNQPIKFLSTLPAMGSIDHEALGIDMADLNALIRRNDVIGLGESYWQNVCRHPERFLSAFSETMTCGKLLEGHSAGASGRKLAAYLSLGISSCHEPITADQVLALLRSGGHVMIREGGIRSDLESIAEIRDMGVDLRKLCLVSDSVTPGFLKEKGYMDAILQKAIDAGFHPLDAVRMVTLNVAEHFHLSEHIGGISPGRYADMLLVKDLREIEAEMVISNGKIIAENGRFTEKARVHNFSSNSRDSIKLPGEMTAEDFNIPAGGDHRTKRGKERVRVIEMVTDLVTTETQMDLDVENSLILPDPDRDILKVTAIDRSSNTKERFNGFITGFGMKAGAFAATGAWDSSHIIVVGADGHAMAGAVNRIREMGGGIVVRGADAKCAELALPDYGLFAPSALSLQEIVDALARITQAVHALGCSFHDPLLSLSALTGAAIPFFRICHKGLFDFKKDQLLSLRSDT